MIERGAQRKRITALDVKTALDKHVKEEHEFWEIVRNDIHIMQQHLAGLNSVMLNGDNTPVSLQVALRQIYDLVKPQKISRDFWTVFALWRERSFFFKFMATKMGKFLFLVFTAWVVLSILNDLGTIGPPMKILADGLSLIFKAL
ncbi:MAG: hypothetical protein WCK00_03260 [Deltaproteobacteria bacterium]